jgi:hypothetical protein
VGVELLRWCRLQWDRVLAVLAAAAGIVTLVLGWAGASRTEYVAKQIPYAVSGGLGCLALLMTGGTLWLSADFRDEWRALDRLEERLGDRLAGDPVLDEIERRLDRLEQREISATPSSVPREGFPIAPSVQVPGGLRPPAPGAADANGEESS